MFMHLHQQQKEALSRTTKRGRKAFWAQPVPVSVPKGVGHLLGVSSRKTVGQSEKSLVTGEEKPHQQNACPHIIGGIRDTFLLKKEHEVTSGPKQEKVDARPAIP